MSGKGSRAVLRHDRSFAPMTTKNKAVFLDRDGVLNEELGTYGEFTPEPDWIIVPIVLNVLDDGTEEWILTSDFGLYADTANLTYNLAALPSGSSLYLELVVVDFGGNTDSVSGTVTVP